MRLVTLLVASFAALGCRDEKPPAPGGPESPPVASADVNRSESVRPPRAGERVAIPTGAFLAGSEPGDPGRVPELELRLTSIDLGAFEIDRLAYPNDPAKPPLVGASRDEADRRCTDAGARLCTELEWERACKGPGNDRFPGGREFDPSCAAKPAQCASGFGVLGMGAAFGEWTRSVLVVDEDPRAVVRGGVGDAGAEAHRCAARRGVEPDAPGLGFRCCKGPPNARKVPEPETLPAYRKHELTGKQLGELLEQHEATKALGKDLVFFSEPEAAETVVSRGPGDRKGFSFTVSPLLWSPVPGAEYLVLSARSGEKTSFVLAFYALGDEKFRLAASFVMKDEPGPVALAYTRDIRPRLHFSTCWGCPGETGKILFRRPERIAIVAP